MVHVNFIALSAIAFGAASVAGASIRNLELQARGAELADLIEAREMAYSVFEARELELIERAQELESRGFDVEEILLFRRIDEAEFKKKILAWLGQAQGDSRYGTTWEMMHGGGTSVSPHCRPYGMKKTVERNGPKKGNKTTKVNFDEYYVKLLCAPKDKNPDSKVTVIAPFLLASGPSPLAAPSAATVYAACAKQPIQMGL